MLYNRNEEYRTNLVNRFPYHIEISQGSILLEAFIYHSLQLEQIKVLSYLIHIVVLIQVGMNQIYFH